MPSDPQEYEREVGTRSFWYVRSDEDFPPETTQDVPTTRSMQRLSVACTQTTLKPYRQRKLVEAWCQALPEMTNLEFLWFRSRVSQPLFDSACLTRSLVGFSIKWSGIKRLDEIQNLQNLKYLDLGGSAQIESLDPLEQCGQLRVLCLENPKKVRDLEAIGKLPNLISLTIGGDAWTTLTVDTLEPLRKLTSLRSLNLGNLKTLDTSLRPLFSLRQLEHLHICPWWDNDEVHELKRLNRCLPR